MTGISVRKAHHRLKNVPVLKWINAAAVFLWFHGVISAARAVCKACLFFKLAAVAFSRRKKLVVVSRFGGIGDIICSFPAVRELIRQNADVQVVYVTRTCYRALIEQSNLGIPCVTVGMDVGFSDRAITFVRRYLQPKYGEETGASELPPVHLFQEFARSMGLAPVSEEPVLRPDPAQVEKIRSQHLPDGKQHFVLLHTGPTWKVKEWPLESWVALVARLRENPEIEVFQIVADRNVTVKDAWSPLVHGAVPIMCADNISKLIDTIAAADLLIGIDSGPAHVAAAVGTSCVALFGPTDPALLAKPARVEAVVHRLDCSFCHHRKPRLHWRTGCPMDIACMKNISMEQVMQKADSSMLESELRK